MEAWEAFGWRLDTLLFAVVAIIGLVLLVGMLFLGDAFDFFESSFDADGALPSFLNAQMLVGTITAIASVGWLGGAIFELDLLPTLLIAAAVGLPIGGFLGWLSAVFRKSEAGVPVTGGDAAGAVGRITLPIRGNSTGRVQVTLEGRTLMLAAMASDRAGGATEFEVGDIVRIEQVTAGVAAVVPFTAREVGGAVAK